MLTRWDADHAVVGRLRFSCRGAERSDAHTRLAAAMSRFSVRPSGLAPSAILCVRELTHRLPGSVGRRTSTPAGAEDGLADTLNRFVQTAARPADGPVPANAEAVLFADPSELLAALASDWRDGLVHVQWWWKYLVSSGGSGVAAREWVAQPQYVPAALAHLARHRRAASTVRAFTAAEATAIARAVACCIGIDPEPFAADVSALIRAPEPPAWMSRVLPAGGDTANPHITRNAGAASSAHESPGHVAPSPPWERLVREANEPGLAPAQQILLGLGLSFQRAPHVVRDRSFAPRVVEWRHAVELQVPDGRPARDASPVSDPDPRIPGRPQGHRGEGVNPAITVDDAYPGDPALPSESSGDIVEAAEIGRPLSEARRLEVDGAPDDGKLAAVSTFSERSIEEPLPAEPPLSYVQTSFGGVFYLVNVAIALELYGDFTNPARPGLSLSIWDFLAIAGRELLGDAFTADPLAPLFARLARRPGNERPGSNFRPDDEWRIPPDWCAAFPERSGWTWSAARARLTVRHPCGFAVVDVLLRQGDRAGDRLARELEPYGLAASDVRRRTTSRADRRGLPIDRWVRQLMPYVRARLQRATGVDANRCAAIVCTHSARVHVSPSHVDVMFALADLPIEVRLGGLDRNPGWVPAAERVITFHYD
jgi:hypothetical protein